MLNEDFKKGFAFWWFVNLFFVEKIKLHFKCTSVFNSLPSCASFWFTLIENKSMKTQTIPLLPFPSTFSIFSRFLKMIPKKKTFLINNNTWHSLINLLMYDQISLSANRRRIISKFITQSKYFKMKIYLATRRCVSNNER